MRLSFTRTESQNCFKNRDWECPAILVRLVHTGFHSFIMMARKLKKCMEGGWGGNFKKFKNIKVKLDKLGTCIHHVLLLF